jgi:hypothetical protein
MYRVRVYVRNLLAITIFRPGSRECSWQVCETQYFRWRWRARLFAWSHSGSVATAPFIFKTEIDEPRNDNVIPFRKRAA